MAEISGIWKIKRNPMFPDNFLSGGSERVDFTSAGDPFWGFRYRMYDDGVYHFQYRGEHFEGSVFTNYQSEGWREGEHFRIVNFGTVPQEISEELADFFKMNATQLNTVTIKGTWLMKATIKTPDTVFGGDNLVSEMVNFSCYSVNYQLTKQYNHMYYDDWNNGSYALYFGDAKVYNHASSAWVDNAYRRIDFGDEGQIVSKEFYDWFTDNATEWACTIVEGVRNNMRLYISGDAGIVLSCEEKIFQNDIIAKGIASVYFGDTLIKNASSNKKLVAKCKDAKARSDITIRAADCISFVIVDMEGKNPKRFVARQGMTWRELADSNYINSVNPFGSYYISVKDYGIDDDEVYLHYDVPIGGHANVETKVDDVLLEDHVYRHGTFSHVGGSN